MVRLWIGLGFAAFGILVGTIAGLSSAELTTTLLGLLFALIGGSIAALLGKLDMEGRRLAGIALLAFSIPALVGLYSGLYVRINDLLNARRENIETVSMSSSDANRSSPIEGDQARGAYVGQYLRSDSLDGRADIINEQLQSNFLSLEEAYLKMYELTQMTEPQ
jgi:hypothetical protein